MSAGGQTAAGVTVPDTKLARDATELIRDHTSDLVYNRSRWVFWWGSLQGRNRGLSWDPELVLDRVAAAEGVSRAELIRELIDRAIGGHPGADLAADLAAINGSFGVLAGDDASGD